MKMFNNFGPWDLNQEILYKNMNRNIINKLNENISNKRKKVHKRGKKSFITKSLKIR